jgi:hypothetical protein
VPIDGVVAVTATQLTLVQLPRWKPQSVEGLQHLWARGQRNFNLAALQNVPVTAADISAFYDKVRSALTLVDAAGIPRNATSVYIMDESGASVDIAVIPRVSAAVKKQFGRGVTVVTCGQNQWWLRRSGKQAFPDVDIFIPPLADHVLKGFVTEDGFGASFANTTAAMKQTARSAGQRVGLYTSGFPYGAKALNWGVELPAIRSRLLMGVAMWRGDSDAFLYYRLNKWSQYVKSAASPPAAPYGKGPLDGSSGSLTPTMEVLRWAVDPFRRAVFCFIIDYPYKT